MSAKWIGYFLDQSDLRDTELLLAIAIADHADADGVSYPGVDLLCRKVRRKTRQVQNLIKGLEAKGYVEIERHWGRGRLTKFQLKKVQSAVHLSETVKGAISDTEKVQSEEAKRCNLEQEKVQSGALKGAIAAASLYKEEPLEPLEPSGGNPHPMASVADEVAIKAVEEAFDIRLDRETRKLVVAAVPPNLIDRFPAFVTGRAVGYRNRPPTEKLARIGYALTDFQKDNRNGTNQQPNFREQRQSVAVADRNIVDAARERIAQRKLSGHDAGDRGGQLRALGPKPNDG